jgi:hypothetical protein
MNPESQNLSNKPKTLFCQDCSVPLFVPKNSGKKRCRSCKKAFGRAYYVAWYRGAPKGCRDKAYKRLQDRLHKDVAYRLLTRAKKSAKERGLAFDLDIGDIQVPDVCPVLKVPMEYKTPYAPSVDRIDSSKGYIKGNIQVMSWKANTMKSSATAEELKSFAAWVNSAFLVDVVNEPRVTELIE